MNYLYKGKKKVADGKLILIGNQTQWNKYKIKSGTPTQNEHSAFDPVQSILNYVIPQ